MNPFLKAVKRTKNHMLALAVLATLPQWSSAAESFSGAQNNKMKIVPSLGYSYFNITGGTVDYKSKSGSSAAVLVQMPMNSDFEIESGLEYLETGAKQTLDFGFLSLDTAKLDVKQLAIPIRAKYNFNPASTGTRYFAKAGVTPTYLLSAKVEGLGESTDVKSSMNDIGFLGQAGLGADWGLDAITGRITFDFTYSYGLTKAFKDVDGRSSGFQLQLGYAFAM
jgi:Outer membrane protein beta-barrel domain